MKNSRYIWYVIGIIIFLIIYPLIFQKGYMFAIDQALPTQPWIPRLWDHIYWVGMLSQIFWFFSIPMWVMEKILILLTFITPAIGWYFLLKETKNHFAIIFWSLLIFINPFLYARFLDWQINIYLLYALIPLFVYFLKQTFDHKNRYIFAFITWVWWMLMCLTTLHAVFFILILSLVFYIIYSIHTKKYIQNFLILGIIFSLQLLWFIPFKYYDNHENQLIDQVQNFNSDHYTAFQDIDNKINVYTENLSLKWYWWEYQWRFAQSDLIDYSGKKNNVIFFIWLLTILWIIFLYREKKFHSFEYSIFILWCISFILSVGISNTNIFSWINLLLYNHLPYYSGFREPQKWVAFLVIGMGYFGAYWIVCIKKILSYKLIHTYAKNFILILLSIIPVMYTYNMLWWFGWQIIIKEYPDEWKEMKLYLSDKWNKVDTKYTSVLFPWHGYMKFEWIWKKTWSWIASYLWENILIWDPVEIWNIYSQSTRLESKIIENYISPNGLFKKTENFTHKNYELFVSDLQKLWIKNIMLLKEADYSWYEEFLDDMIEKWFIEQKLENDMLYVYEIKK